MYLVSGDRFFKENSIKNINFIKIDVEGHELYVLDGIKETIIRDRPFIVMEYNDRNVMSGFQNTFQKIFKNYSVYFITSTHQRRAFISSISLLQKIAQIFYTKILKRSNKALLLNKYKKSGTNDIFIIPNEKITLIDKKYFSRWID